MGGFGYGSFGHIPFGEWWWSRAVFYDLIPSEYKREDLNQNNVLEKLAETLRLSFDRMRRKIRGLDDLRDPLLARTVYDEAEVFRLGKIIYEVGEIEQRGVDGAALATKEFYSATSRFTVADIGKTLTIRGSLVASNNRTVTVTSILGPSIVLTEPVLTYDLGPFTWEVRAIAEQLKNKLKVEVRSGDVAPVNIAWIVDDGYAKWPITTRKQFPVYDDKRLLTEKEGQDGYVNSLGRFVSPSAAFKQEDVGKKLTILASEITDNLDRYEIVRVVSTTIVVLNEVLTPDSGPLTWAVLPFPELTLSGVSPLPKGIVQQDGVDGSLMAGAPNSFSALSAKFTSDDVGRMLTFWGSSTLANDGTYVIDGLVSDTQVTFTAVGLVNDLAGTIRWEVRDRTEIGDGTQVNVYAPDILGLLATDFGIEIDTREDEEFQRRWVHDVSRWINRKGWSETYKFLANLTGFDCEVTHLFRVSQDIASTLPAGSLVVVGEAVVGRFGIDGALFLNLGWVRFFSPTATFTSSDVGRQIAISSSLLGNNGYRTIETVVNSNTVQFRAIDTATTPDPAGYPGVVGDLEWAIVRLYSLYAPTLPVYDEINIDLMTTIKTAAVFTADKYCWESNWSTTIGPGFGGGGDGDLRVVSSEPPTSSLFPVTYTVEVDGDIDVVTGLGIGRWKLIDNDATPFFLEDVPVLKLETGVGRSGANGSLVAGPNFVSPTGAFVAGDVGKRVVISGAGAGHNNRTYKIVTIVGPTTVTLTEAPPTLPDPNNGTLVWAIASYTFPVKATEPPDVGAATIQYICSVQPTCSFCPSNKVLIEASTALLMEDPFDRLIDRLEQAKPAHVELVYSVGLEIEASLNLTAVVETP